MAEQARNYRAAYPQDCFVCGEPIPEARRLALPGVCTCIECQTDIERELRAT
ncbi:MAG: TraR/DksA C4-type zinc finger protein [Azonexus sp.]|nr:TraR/DksA C4-type zinc finger protein [Azonexus sp.]